MKLDEAFGIIEPFISKINYKSAKEWRQKDRESPFFGLYALAMFAVEDNKDLFIPYFRKVCKLFNLNDNPNMSSKINLAIHVLEANIHQSYSLMQEVARPKHLDLEGISREIFDDVTFAYDFPNKIDDVYFDRFNNAVVENDKFQMKLIHLRTQDDFLAYHEKSKSAIVCGISYLDREQIGWYVKPAK